MLEFFWNLLAVAPLLVAFQVINRANLSREVRVRQVPIPGVAVLYLVISLYVLYRFNELVRGVIEWLGNVIPFVSPPSSAGAFYIVENVFALALFAVLKVSLRPLFALVFDGERRLGQTLVAGLYDYVREYDMWFVSPRFAGVRSYLRVLYWTSVAFTVLFVASARTFETWPGFAVTAYPALATLVVGEFFFAIDGLTKQEFDRDILGERDSSRRVANYGPLRSILRETFPGRVLADGVHLSSRAALDSGFKVGEMVRADDPAERLAGGYFDRLSRSRKDLDVNLVAASSQLLRGASVLINNPFYVDLTPYLALPAYYNLLKYRKVLVICGRDALADDLVNWIVDGLEGITGVPDLWQVEVLNTISRDGTDVGILRFGDIHNHDLLSANDGFFANVGLIILAEPARMLATGQLGLRLVLDRCSQGFSPAVAAFDGNYDGLVDALSHLLKVDLTEVVASALPRGASSEVVWEAVGPHLHLGILPPMAQYLGLGTEIGAVALKYQVKQVQWIGSDSFPVRDMMWIAGQYFSQIGAFADLDVSQDALKEALTAEANPGAIAQRDNSFLIVEDEVANVFETVRQFSTRGTRVGFVNVISQDYMLRDYMVANRDLFSSDPKAVPAIAADFARTERNAVLRLLLSLVTFGVSEQDLLREFELIGLPVATDLGSDDDQEKAVATLLRRLVKTHTGVSDLDIQYHRMTDPESATFNFLGTPMYAISPGAELEALLQELRSAYFFVEDEAEDVNRIGALLSGHVYQSLLPGQFITHAGKYYEVQSISDGVHSSGVVLRRAADHIRDRRVYRQLRKYSLNNVQLSTTSAARRALDKMEFVRCTADIEAASLGYIQLPSRSALDQGQRVRIDDLPVRRYRNKTVLAIRLPGITDTVRRTISLLLNELFITTFPHSYQYVSAVTVGESGSLSDLLPEFALDVDSMTIPGDGQEYIFVIEDSMVDLGLVVAVERHWHRFMNILADYLAWNESPKPEDSPEEVGDFIPTFPDRPQLIADEPWWKQVVDRIAGRQRTGSGRAPATVGIGDAGTREASPEQDVGDVEPANAAKEPEGGDQVDEPTLVADEDVVLDEGDSAESADLAERTEHGA